MTENKTISKEDVHEYMAFQIKTIQECAKKFNLKILYSYLDLAEQILDEELHQQVEK